MSSAPRTSILHPVQRPDGQWALWDPVVRDFQILAAATVARAEETERSARAAGAFGDLRVVVNAEVTWESCLAMLPPSLREARSQDTLDGHPAGGSYLPRSCPFCGGWAHELTSGTWRCPNGHHPDCRQPAPLFLWAGRPGPPWAAAASLQVPKHYLVAYFVGANLPEQVAGRTAGAMARSMGLKVHQVPDTRDLPFEYIAALYSRNPARKSRIGPRGTVHKREA